MLSEILIPELTHHKLQSISTALFWSAVLLGKLQALPIYSRS